MKLTIYVDFLYFSIDNFPWALYLCMETNFLSTNWAGIRLIGSMEIGDGGDL
jgi:hypothetical protein